MLSEFTNYRILKYTSFFVLASLLLNCKKEADTDPLIEFINPPVFLNVSVYDSIFVEADVSDDGTLTMVSIQLLYQNEIPAGNEIVYHPNNNHFHLSTLYHIDNPLLESGTYLLTIKASDGRNTTRRAREIEIQAIPLERLKVLALSTSSGIVNVHQLDTAQGNTLFATLNSDYLSSSISSRHQRINILSSSRGPFSVLDANSGLLINEVQGNCPLGTPCFENLHFQNEFNFISYYDGKIRAFDADGLQRFEVQQEGYFRPDKVFWLDDYFYAELDYLNPQEKRLGTFFYPSGSLQLESPLDMDIVKMLKRSQDELYLLGHLNGNTVIKIFSRLTNRSVLLRNLGTMTLNSVYDFESTDIFLATDQGLWKYNIYLNSMVQLRSTPLQSINYDPLFNELYLAEQNVIRVLDGGTFLEKKHYSLADSVLNVLLLYNR